MIGGATWMEDQRRAALTDTALLARRIAVASGAKLVPGPRGPWSAATTASVGQAAAERREVCDHLAVPSFAVIPHGPRPLVVPRRGYLSCTRCAAAQVPPRRRSDPCQGCTLPTLTVRAVVAHGSVLIMLGRLCPRCLAVEIHGTTPSGRRP